MVRWKAMSELDRVHELASPHTDSAHAESTLDALDRSIISRLQFNGREPVAHMARELGQDRRTISRRIDALLDAGIIRFAVVTNPQILGYRAMALVCISLKGGVDGVSVFEKICAFPETDYVTLTTGRYSIQAEVICRDDAELAQSLSRRFAQLPEIQHMEVLYYLRLHFQRAWFGNDGEPRRTIGIQPVETDEIDRSIIVHLAGDARMPFKALADRVGISETLARKRYEALVESNVMRVITIASPLRIGFHVSGWVAITTTPNGRTSEIAEALSVIREVSYVAITAGSIDLMVEVVCRDHEHLISVIDEQIKQVEGVERSEMWMYLDLEYKAILPPLTEASESRGA